MLLMDTKGERRPIRRRHVLKSAGVSATFAILAGCTSNKGGGGGNKGNGGTKTSSGEYPNLSGKEVHFLTDETAEGIQSVLKNFVADFKSTTGASVNFETMGIGGTAQNRLSQLIQAGSPPEAFFNHDHSGSSTLVSQDLLAPMTEGMQAITDQFGTPPDGTRIQSQGGEDYFIPTTAFPGVMWYRKDIVGDIPRQMTWEKFAQVVEENDNKQGMRSFFALRGKDTCTALTTAIWGSSNGGYIAERVDGEVKAALTADGNMEKWIKVLEFTKRIGQHSPRNADAGCAEAIQAIPTETASISGYVGARPKRQTINQKKPFADQLVATHWPRPKGKEEQVTYGTPKGLVRFNTDNNKASKAFWNFFIKEGYYRKAVLAQTPAAWPVFPGITETDQYDQLKNKLMDKGWTQRDLEVMQWVTAHSKAPAADMTPPNPSIGVFYGALDLAELRYAVELDGMTPEAALKKYNQQIQEGFDKSSGA